MIVRRIRDILPSVNDGSFTLEVMVFDDQIKIKTSAYLSPFELTDDEVDCVRSAVGQDVYVSYDRKVHRVTMYYESSALFDQLAEHFDCILRRLITGLSELIDKKKQTISAFIARFERISGLLVEPIGTEEYDRQVENGNV